MMVAASILVSCATENHAPPETPTLPAPPASYAPNAIGLVLRADPQLNLYDGIHHALNLCVYQLKDPNAFTQLSNEKDGLQLILSCGTFDPSVTNFTAIVLQHGQVLSQTLDRAEGTRWVGLAASYYTLDKERIIRLLPIPVEVKRKGWAFWNKYQVLAPLNLEIELGPHKIKNVEVRE
jgi:type VI secretion system VasD/TssJ family lipoprotein